MNREIYIYIGQKLHCPLYCIMDSTYLGVFLVFQSGQMSSQTTKKLSIPLKINKKTKITLKIPLHVRGVT